MGWMLLVYRAAARTSAGSAVCWASQDGWAIMKPRSAAMLARAGDRLHAGWLPMTVDRETPLQPRVLLDRVVVVVVASGRRPWRML